jgi:glutamate dehydrogenase
MRRRRRRTRSADPRASTRTRWRGLTDGFGTVDRRAAADAGYELLPKSGWLEQGVDVFVPAALENQITCANASRIHGQVRVVLEAANGPMTAEANQALDDRGVLVIPDILANAGGVTCSYFEQVQGNSNYYWSAEEVLQKLDSWMTEAFIAVHHVAERERLSLRDAAYSIAIDRVARACRERGWV